MHVKSQFSSSSQELFINYQNEDLTLELEVLSKTKFADSEKDFKRDILFYLTKKEAKTCIEDEVMSPSYVNYATGRAEERGEFKI